MYNCFAEFAFASCSVFKQLLLLAGSDYLCGI